MPATLRHAALGVGIALALATPARAHDDPAGCTSSGVALTVSLFRADGTTGLVGSASECERIVYRVKLRKADPSACAVSGGTLTLTTADGVAHRLFEDVPSFGGAAATTDVLESAPVPYVVQARDVANGAIRAIARYDGGLTHDGSTDTPGLSAVVDRNVSIVWCADADPCTDDGCDPTKPAVAACSNLPRCDDDDPLTTDACADGRCTFSPIASGERLVCAGRREPATLVPATRLGIGGWHGHHAAAGKARGSRHAHPGAHP